MGRDETFEVQIRTPREIGSQAEPGPDDDPAEADVTATPARDREVEDGEERSSLRVEASALTRESAALSALAADRSARRGGRCRGFFFRTRERPLGSRRGAG